MMRTMSACCLRDSLKLSDEVEVIGGATCSLKNYEGSRANEDRHRAVMLWETCGLRGSRGIPRGKLRLVAGVGGALDFLNSLYVMDARDLPYPVHDLLQVFQVGDLKDDVDAGLSVLAAGFYVADVGVSVADDC